MHSSPTLPKLAFAAAFALTGVLGCADTLPPSNVDAGRSLRPEGTDAAEVPVPLNAIYFFENDGFAGNTIHVDNVTAQPHEGLHAVGPASDRMSSVRWNLPPGVVVVLHEHAEGTGDQMVLWGQGQAASMTPWDFNDKLSRYSWHNVGGVVSAQTSLRPPDAQPLGANLAPGVIELFADRGLRGRMSTLGPVSHFATGARHATTELTDQMTSLRWNLPPGVVVVFYEDAARPGEQLAIWGQGQYDSISHYDFNDKVSRWAWYDLSGATSHASATPTLTPAPGVTSRTITTTTTPGTVTTPGTGTTPAPGTTVITETKTTTVRTETVPPAPSSPTPSR